MSRAARTGDVPAVETVGLGKRYGQTWGLQDCSVQVPKGAISPFCPNLSCKLTLTMWWAAFCLSPGDESVRVLGLAHRAKTRLPGSVGYLARWTSLPATRNVDEHLEPGSGGPAL